MPFSIINLKYRRMIAVFMDVRSQDKKAEDVEADVLVVGCFEPCGSVPDNLKALDSKAGGEIANHVSKDDFSGERKQWRSICAKGVAPGHIIVLGAGKKDKLDLEGLRKLAGFATRLARDKFSAKSVALQLSELEVKGSSKAERAQAVTEGAVLSDYRFDKYKTVDKDKRKVLESLVILTEEKDAVTKGKTLADCALFCRDLQDECPSNMTPEALAQKAKGLEKLGVKVTVFDKAACKKEGFEALLAVNRGSVNEPRMVVMEYDGKGSKKVALVGKGITFDSGGLDIKPADGMLTMKMDMSGAAVVLSTVKAAAELKLPIKLVGVFGATENMPGQNAYKQGDVVKAYNGKTIEIMHTDAEGRVVLADALSYTEAKLKPDVMIDLATLTGACVVALGSVCAGVMGKHQDIIDQLKSSGNSTGERVWQLPFWQEYHDMVKADFADVRNTGSVKRQAGAITAGTFLSNFVDKVPWAHIDIAGPAWSDKSNDYTGKGGTGFGVRLLIDFLENYK